MVKHIPYRTDVGDNTYPVVGESRHKTKCRNSNNPAGHNPECPCGWAGKHHPPTAPAVDGITESPHTDWWPAGKE